MMLHLSPTSAKPTASISSPSVLFSDEPSVATWEMWDAIRTVCDYNPRLTLSRAFPAIAHSLLTKGVTALDLTPPLPSVLSVLSQWSAEPVRNIFLPVTTFIANAKGYPVLPKVTQSFIWDMIKVSLLFSLA